MEDIILASRSMNDELYAMAHSLVEHDIPRVQLRGTDAAGYFYELMKLDARWVINLDEDAFLWDFEQVLALRQFMESEGYACCGMPDGGVVADRFHNPVAANAFFNILHVEKLRESFAAERVALASYEDDLEACIPRNLLRTGAYACDEFEPYYRFFFWLLRSGHKMLYLDAVQWARDPISTVLLDHMRKPMLIHCWYARAFNEQRPRFMHAYQYCAQLKQKCDGTRRGVLWNRL